MPTQDRSPVTVLDGGVLIALATGEQTTRVLSQDIASAAKLFTCTELALSELTYIICRKTNWQTAAAKVDTLIRSATIQIIPASLLWKHAAHLKCTAAIALPDCYTIAAADILKGNALFARKEPELTTALKKRLIPRIIQFLQ